MVHAFVSNNKMNVHVISTFEARLVIFHLIVANVWGANKTVGSCCRTLKVSSKNEDDTKIHAIGHYHVVNISADNWVYKQKNGTVHISFSHDHGWTGYPNEPDDSDIPALSFLDCNEKCPEKCVSNEKWKYYNYESFNFIVDPTLELGCDGGLSPTMVAVIIIMFLVIMLAIVICVIWKRKKILKWGYFNKYVKCLSEETTVNEESELNEVPNQNVEPYSLVLNVSYLKAVTLPNNQITLNVSVDEEAEKHTTFTYKWIVMTEDEKTREIGKDQSELRIENLSEGSYIFKVYVKKRGGADNHELAKGDFEGEIIVYPEPSVCSPPYKIHRVPKVIETKEKLWHDSPDNIIESLGSDDLKSSVLFQLPKNSYIKKGTGFTLKACPSSLIHVVCKGDDDFDFGPEWKKLNGTVHYKSTSIVPGRSTNVLDKIWSRKLDKEHTSVQLTTTQDDVKAAIFILQGTE